MTRPRIEVEGLAEFRRALARAGPNARKILTAEMRGVAEFVRDTAVYEANAKGLNRTGDLIAGLKAGVSGTSGFVRDTARHGGYNYPARLEYEHGGERAFIRPAVDAGRDQIEARLIKAVEHVIDDLGGNY